MSSDKKITVEPEQVTPSLPARLTREFHEVFGLPIDNMGRTSNALRAELIREESEEAAVAVEGVEEALRAAERECFAPEYVRVVDSRRAALAKELADTVIALYGTAVTMGIDLDEAVRLVHASNMSKVDEKGRPIVSEGGKVLKPPGYVEPDMSSAVRPLGETS